MVTRSRSSSHSTLPSIPDTYSWEICERQLMERRQTPEEINDRIGLPRYPPGPHRGQGRGPGLPATRSVALIYRHRS